MQKSPKVSVIIPSLNRPESLSRVEDSLEGQTFLDFETVILREEGPLAQLRNQGAKKSKGDILVFIDDDVRLPRTWLQGILSGFKTEDIAGVSGPAVITPQFMWKRDLFRFPRIKKAYDWIFLEGMERLPGRITRSGAWTTGACFERYHYTGEVDFLEACNSAYRRSIFFSAGGFDERFRGIGDWSEPDLAFRIRKMGWRLWYTPEAKLYHEPSLTGAYLKRSSRSYRFENYLLFSQRWVKPCWRHTLYKSFLAGYYFAKEKGWIK